MVATYSQHLPSLSNLEFQLQESTIGYVCNEVKRAKRHRIDKFQRLTTKINFDYCVD